MTDSHDDPILALFRRMVDRHGRGRHDVRFLAEEALSFPGECESIAELQARVVAQLAGLIEALVDLDILDDSDKTQSVLLNMMRATSNR